MLPVVAVRCPLARQAVPLYDDDRAAAGFIALMTTQQKAKDNTQGILFACILFFVVPVCQNGTIVNTVSS